MYKVWAGLLALQKKKSFRFWSIWDFAFSDLGCLMCTLLPVSPLPDILKQSHHREMVVIIQRERERWERKQK
jgi:putative SOS response-associated peptidase YedK